MERNLTCVDNYFFVQYEYKSWRRIDVYNWCTEL